MKQINRIAIIGLGLIGASFGLALKKSRVAKKIVGLSRKDSTLEIAKKRKAVDIATKDLSEALNGADFVILATPVQAIINLAPLIAENIGKKTIVSDVGSTKEEIVSTYEKLGVDFVGAHPLAGSEKTGPNFADSQLFGRSLCIVTASNNTKVSSLNKVKRLWKIAGSKTHILSPQQHDIILASVSHLPHVVAFSLINIIPDKYFKYAPNSLKDVTRIAASDAKLWRDIFLSNSDALLNNINKYKKDLERIEHLIRIHDRKKLFELINSSSSKRLKI